MHTIRTGAVAGALVALVAAGVAAPAASQATPRPRPVATSAFTTVHATTFTAQAVGSPAAGEVVVAGVKAAAGTEGPIMVDLAKKNRWRTLTLAARASRVKVATAGGTTWILGMGTTPTLWRSQGNHFVQVPMPKLSAPMTSYAPTAIAAEGRSVALWGMAGYANRPGMGATARLDNGVWTVKDHLQPPQYLYGPTTTMLPSSSVAALVQGHLLTDTSISGGIGYWVHIFDYTPSPAVRVGTVLLAGPLGDVSGIADLIARTPSDVTVWGGQEVPTTPAGPILVGKGLCMTLKAGTANACPAPTWKVSAATRLADGRTVLGGEDTYTYIERRLNGKRGGLVPGGYALVTKDGATPNTFPGDPGDKVVDLAAEPTGTTVWSVVRTGTATAVQRGTVAPTFTFKQGRR